MKTEKIIQEIYRLTSLLEDKSDRPFTLDGHLVGSIGEVAAAERDQLDLAIPSEEGFDATDIDGRKVEIKTSQRNRVGMRSCPERLIIQRLLPDGTVVKIYDGPGEPVWSIAGSMQKNGVSSQQKSDTLGV